MVKILLLNSSKKVIGRYTDTVVITGTRSEKINEPDKIDVELNLNNSNLNSDLIESVRYVIVSNSKIKLAAYKVIHYRINTNSVEFTGINYGYDELEGIPLDTPNLNEPVKAWLNSQLQPYGYEVYVNNTLDLKYLDTEDDTLEHQTAIEFLKDIIHFNKVEYRIVTQFTEDSNSVDFKRIYLDNRINNSDIKARYVYGTNAADIMKESNTAQVYTAAIGYGMKDNNGKRLTFEDLDNPSLNKPAGQKYVEYTDSQTYNTWSGRKVKIFVYDDEEDPVQLLNRTYKDLQDIARPKVHFRTRAVDDFEQADLGSSIAVIRHDIGIKYLTRVFYIVDDLLTGKRITLDFGEYTFESRNKRTKEVQQSVQILSRNDNTKTRRISDLERRIQALSDRLDQCCGGGEVVIPMTPPEYFTYAPNEETGEGVVITSLSDLGKEALDNGELEYIKYPDTDGEGNSVGGISIQGIGNDIHIDGPMYIEPYIKFIDNRSIGATAIHIEEGLERIDSGMNIKSGYIRIPYTLTSIARNFMFGGNVQNCRLSVPHDFGLALNNSTVVYLYRRENVEDKVENGLIYREIETNGVKYSYIQGITQEEVVRIESDPEIETLTIPEKINGLPIKISNHAFRGYRMYITYNIEAEIDTTGEHSFASVKAKEVNFKNRIEVIGPNTFMYADIDTYTFTNTTFLNEIGSNAFNRANIPEFTIPNSVQTLGSGAFDNSNIERITLSNQIINILDNTFRQTNLKHINTENIEYIGSRAFLNADLDNFTFGNNFRWVDVSGLGGNNLSGVITLPQSTQNIRGAAFAGNNLEEARIPVHTSVTSNAFDSDVTIVRY